MSILVSLGRKLASARSASRSLQRWRSCVAVVGVAVRRRRRLQPVRHPEGLGRPMPTASCSPPTSGSLRSDPHPRRQRPARVEHDQPQRPVPGRDGLERLLSATDDRRPARPAADRPADRRSTGGTGSRRGRTVGARRPAVLARRQHALGPPVRLRSTSSASTPAPARPRRPRIALCGEARTTVGAATANIGPSTASGAYLPSGHGAVARRQHAVCGAQRRQHAGRDRHRDQHADAGRSRSATRRARSCSPTTARSPTSPTRAAARPTTPTSPTSPTAPRSSRARSTGAAITGTVSVVNLTTGKEAQEIPVGLQPTALYQDGYALFVANSNDDSMSVINEQTNTVAQTVNTNPVPGATVGSYANAINMSDPKHVLVSIGRDNAIAVYSYGGLHRPMTYEGLLPTDWYPVQVQPDPALGAGRSWSPTTRASAPRARVDDQQGPERHRADDGTSQHLRRHRQRDRIQDAARRTRSRVDTQTVFTRQRLGPDQADQPRRLRHRAVGDPDPSRRHPHRSSTSS